MATFLNCALSHMAARKQSKESTALECFWYKLYSQNAWTHNKPWADEDRNHNIWMVYLTCVLWGAGSWSTALSKREKQYHSPCNFHPLIHSSRGFKEKQSVKGIMFTNQSKKSDTGLISFNKHFANGSSWSREGVKDCKMLILHDVVYSIFLWKNLLCPKGIKLWLEETQKAYDHHLIASNTHLYVALKTVQVLPFLHMQKSKIKPRIYTKMLILFVNFLGLLLKKI